MARSASSQPCAASARGERSFEGSQRRTERQGGGIQWPSGAAPCYGPTRASLTKRSVCRGRLTTKTPRSFPSFLNRNGRPNRHNRYSQPCAGSPRSGWPAARASFLGPVVDHGPSAHHAQAPVLGRRGIGRGGCGGNAGRGRRLLRAAGGLAGSGASAAGKRSGCGSRRAGRGSCGATCAGRAAHGGCAGSAVRDAATSSGLWRCVGRSVCDVRAWTFGAGCGRHLGHVPICGGGDVLRSGLRKLPRMCSWRTAGGGPNVRGCVRAGWVWSLELQPARDHVAGVDEVRPAFRLASGA